MKEPKKELVEFSKALLGDIENERQRLLKDKRSTATYWNGDDWGSISGIRDAHKWVETQLAQFVAKEISAEIAALSAVRAKEKV